MVVLFLKTKQLCNWLTQTSSMCQKVINAESVHHMKSQQFHWCAKNLWQHFVEPWWDALTSLYMFKHNSNKIWHSTLKCRHAKWNSNVYMLSVHIKTKCVSGFVAPCRLGASPECVCVAREAWGDQEDDGNGSQGHWEAGGNSGDGGHRQTDG